jgi:RecA-family ATPase
MNPESLPVVRIDEIVQAEDRQRWLIDPLWGAASVGVIGGAPKCSKTWLALDMALSVATGTACLNQYAVPQAGPVLVYLAEDSLPVVRERVEGMARQRGLRLDAIPIHVITTSITRARMGSAALPPVKDCVAPATSMPSGIRISIFIGPAGDWCFRSNTGPRRLRRR